MFKRLLMAFMTLTAFAIPASAMATNEPTLVENGSSVAVGSTFLATGLGELFFTDTSGSGLLSCTSTRMTGTVTKNSSDTVEGTIATSSWSGTGVGGDCTGSFGGLRGTVPPLCIRSNATMATDEFQIYADNCTGNPTFAIDVTGVGECVFEATAGGIKGDFTTNQAELALRNTQAGSGMKKISGSFLCPSSTMLRWTFNLETENGTPITIVDTTP